MRETWTKNDIDRLYKELTKIVSPFSSLKPPFRIFVTSNENIEEYRKKPVITDAIQYSSASATIGFDSVNKQQEVLEDCNDVTGEIIKLSRPYRSFWPGRHDHILFRRES